MAARTTREQSSPSPRPERKRCSTASRAARETATSVCESRQLKGTLYGTTYAGGSGSCSGYHLLKDAAPSSRSRDPAGEPSLQLQRRLGRRRVSRSWRHQRQGDTLRHDDARRRDRVRRPGLRHALRDDAIWNGNRPPQLHRLRRRPAPDRGRPQRQGHALQHDLSRGDRHRMHDWR